jgi:nucleoside-diphosphate-sugar epimerase
MSENHIIVFGLGYSGTAIARAAVAAGFRVTATSRRPAGVDAGMGVQLVAFDEAADAITDATHAIATAAPDDAGDPVIAGFGGALRLARRLVWAGYISTTGVYGDRGGGWVDEDSDVAPGTDRAHRRIDAERAWGRLADRLSIDIFRTAGIYGPGRSALDDVRTGRARRIIKPGHAFGRIHREDIARAVISAAMQTRPPGVRILHLSDDAPAENADVVAEAARLLGAPELPAVLFADATQRMSAMGRSFWSENRRVASIKTQAALGLRWRYPTYREGLRAILAEEGGDGCGQ